MNDYKYSYEKNLMNRHKNYIIIGIIIIVILTFLEIFGFIQF